MESRKRKAESEEKKKKKRKKSDSDPSESKEMKEMRQLFELIQRQITELNKDLLTIADIASVEILKRSLEEGEVLLSWRNKKPELICKHDIQRAYDCWAHALARALSAFMKQLGVTESDDLPTAEKLLAKIDKKLISKTGLLRNLIDAAPLILEEYGYELSVYHRPKMHLTKENEEFEKFIERRLAIGPVAMCFPYVKGYETWDQRKKEVFCPRPSDIESMDVEKLDDHCAVISGRGMRLRGGELIEFWEVHETRGANFADEGFARLQRHKMLVSEVVVFKKKIKDKDIT